MSTAQDFFDIGDKTALICDDSANLDRLKTTIEELGYKTHSAETSERAIERMKYTAYDLITVTETLAGSNLETNGVLRYLGPLPMAQRRNSFILLVGESFRTLDAMQAYTQSVHLVVNPSDLINLGPVLKKGLTEFAAFYRVYNEVLSASGEGG
jgi:CheY-like chemotaxis protein